MVRDLGADPAMAGRIANQAEFAVISRRFINLLLTAAIAVPAVPVMTVSSEAQIQLHELLFGRRPRRERVIREEPEQRRPAPQAIKRVSGPRYYTYKAEAMSAVALASLLPAAAESGGMSMEPSLDFEAKRFSEALRLTVPGGPLTLWERPAWLKPGGLSYHDRRDRWLRGGRLRSVARGQEFVADVGRRKAPREWLTRVIAEIRL